MEDRKLVGTTTTKIKKEETELKQNEDELQQQQYNNLIQMSALQVKLDDTRHGVPVEGSCDQVLKEQLEAEQEAPVAKEREAAALLNQREEHNLISKN